MTRAFPAGYRHPQPRSAWSGQLLLAVLLGAWACSRTSAGRRV
jgi:hypothetical protein